MHTTTLARLLLFLAAVTAHPASLSSKIDKLAKDSRANIGVHVVSLKNGKVLYARNADKAFTPASNTKLYSTALALMKLGPEHKFRTVAGAAAAPDAQGVLRSDLILRGSGDPSFSGRPYPYSRDAQAQDSLSVLDDFAEQLLAKGVRRIEGDIVGDDTLYAWNPYPDGWALDDPVWGYGAPISALSFGDNLQSLRVQGGPEARAPTSITLRPAVEHYAIVNRAVTVAGGRARITLHRLPGSRTIEIHGSVPANGADTSSIAIDDPALFTAAALKNSLEQRGITVTGAAVARHRLNRAELPSPEPAVPLAERTSPPLWLILQVVNKVSQNLHAELVKLAAGGEDAMKAFLLEAGVEKDGEKFPETRLQDGSGLSRLNLITPRATTRLLAFLAKSPHGPLFESLLPIGGQDGTLAGRFEGMKNADRIHAKTGTLSQVLGLSGFSTTRKKERVVFAILMNGALGSGLEYRKIMDKIAIALTE